MQLNTPKCSRIFLPQEMFMKMNKQQRKSKKKRRKKMKMKMMNKTMKTKRRKNLSIWKNMSKLNWMILTSIHLWTSMESRFEVSRLLKNASSELLLRLELMELGLMISRRLKEPLFLLSILPTAVVYKNGSAKAELQELRWRSWDLLASKSKNPNWSTLTKQLWKA